MRGSSGALRSEPHWLVLCGPTGSGKTALLHALRRHGAQTLDLESLARHRGSAFGALHDVQPSQDQFRRSLARTLAGADPRSWLWAEHEAPYLGSLWLPAELVRRLSAAPALMLSVPREHRRARVLDEYGALPAEMLLAGVARLASRLGDARTAELRRSIEAARLAPAVDLLLEYYDELYAHQLAKRTGPIVRTIELDGRSIDDLAQGLLRETKRTITTSARGSASSGMRQTRGASAGNGRVEPGLRPSTSQNPNGAEAVRDSPGLIRPKMSSRSS